MKIVRLKLDKYLISAGVTRYKLAKDAKIGYDTVDKYYKNTITRYDSYLLAKFCVALNCDISDIIESVEDDLA